MLAAKPKKRALVKLKMNPIYAKYLMPCTARWVFVFGGAGSGKSVATGQKIAVRLNTEKSTTHTALCVRKVYSTVEDSMYSRLMQELDSHGLGKAFNYRKSPLKIIRKHARGKKPHQSSRVLFRGMDNGEKIKSLEGITMIWIEEGTELTEEEFLQLDLRLRGESNHYYQIIVTFNPVSKNHWLAKYVEPQMFEEEERHEGTGKIVDLVPNKVWEYERKAEIDGEERRFKVRTINTTAADNDFLPAEYRTTLAALGASSNLMYTVYTKGRWGVLNKDELFFPTFNHSKHVKSPAKLSYNPDLPLHLSIDFNIQPYMSGLIFQMEYIKNSYWNGYKNYWEVRVIDEIAAKSPHNSAHGLAEQFSVRYSIMSGFYLYGDATGTRGLGVKDTKSLFQDFERGLGPAAGFMNWRVPKSNPRYKAIAKGALGRHAFCSRLFSGDTVPIRMLVSSKCKTFIKDLEEVKVTPEGKIKKIKNKDGIELVGHFSDCYAYFVCHPDSLGEYAYSIIKPAA